MIDEFISWDQNQVQTEDGFLYRDNSMTFMFENVAGGGHVAVGWRRGDDVGRLGHGRARGALHRRRQDAQSSVSFRFSLH